MNSNNKCKTASNYLGEIDGYRYALPLTTPFSANRRHGAGQCMAMQ
jgi:hypothetical protein